MTNDLCYFVVLHVVHKALLLLCYVACGQQRTLYDNNMQYLILYHLIMGIDRQDIIRLDKIRYSLDSIR